MHTVIVDLVGPDFARSANGVLTQLAGARISELRLYPGTAMVDVPALAAAVNQLKPLFGLDAVVTLYEVTGVKGTLLRVQLGVKIGMPVGTAPPPPPAIAQGPAPAPVLTNLPGTAGAARAHTLGRLLAKINALKARSTRLAGITGVK